MHRDRLVLVGTGKRLEVRQRHGLIGWCCRQGVRLR
jgi:hypothetical protein